MLRNLNVIFCIHRVFLIILKSISSSIRSYIFNYKKIKSFKIRCFAEEIFRLLVPKDLFLASHILNSY